MAILAFPRCDRCRRLVYNCHAPDAALARAVVASIGWRYDAAADKDYCFECVRVMDSYAEKGEPCPPYRYA